MKFGTHFDDGLRSYLTKIRKNPSWGIFFIKFLNYGENLPEKLLFQLRKITIKDILSISKFPSYSNSKCFVLISTSKGKVNVKDSPSED